MKPEDKGSWLAQVRAQIRGYLLDNLALKGLAVLIVTVLWLSVAGQQRIDVEEVSLRNLDLTLQNPPPNLVVTGTDISKVDVRIKGPREQVRELRLAATLQTSDIVPTADLTNIQEGVKQVPIRIEGLPEGVKLVDGQNAITPPIVRVVLEEMTAKSVKVETRFSGQLPPGYRLVRWTVTPDTVRLSGAESALKEITQVQTTTVNLNGHQATFTDSTAEIDIPLPGQFTAVPARVSVTVEVAPEIGEHTIEAIPVQVPGLPDSTVTPPTVAVTVRGPLPVLRSLAPGDFAAVVGDDGRPPGRARPSEVVVTGPSDRGVEVLRVQPESVTWKR
jgi:YbbR domain-containing protein